MQHIYSKYIFFFSLKMLLMVFSLIESNYFCAFDIPLPNTEKKHRNSMKSFEPLGGLRL